MLDKILSVRKHIVCAVIALALLLSGSIALLSGGGVVGANAADLPDFEDATFTYEFVDNKLVMTFSDSVLTNTLYNVVLRDIYINYKLATGMIVIRLTGSLGFSLDISRIDTYTCVIDVFSAGLTYGDVIDAQVVVSKKKGTMGVDYYPLLQRLQFDMPKLPVDLPPDPVKEGYTFTGWFFDSACTQAYDGRSIYEDTILYAGWAINSYTVNFVVNGGEDLAPITQDYNTTISVTPSRPDGDLNKLIDTDTIAEWSFDGWYTDAGFGQRWQTTDKLKSDLTLYAMWTRNYIDVTFSVYSTSYDFYFLKDVTYAVAKGKKASVIASALDISNALVSCKHSTGWAYNDDFTGLVSADDKTVNDNIALYLPLVIKTYTVKFIVDGSEYASLTVEHGATFEQVAEQLAMTEFDIYSDLLLFGSAEGLITEGGNYYAVPSHYGAMARMGQAIDNFWGEYWVYLTIIAGSILLITLFGLGLRRRRRGY